MKCSTPRIGLILLMSACLSALACGDEDGGTGHPAPADPHAFCRAFHEAACARAYDDCAGELAGDYGGYDDAGACEVAFYRACARSYWPDTVYDAESAASCVDSLYTGPCSQFLAGLPESCGNAIQPATPNLTGCIAASIGATAGLLDASDPTYMGRPYDCYLLELEAGQHISLAVAAGSAPALQDSVLTLYDAARQPVAFNDDAPGTYYSRIDYDVPASGSYAAMVSCYDQYDHGAYEITVSVD